MCGFAGLLNNSFPVYKKQIIDIGEKVSFRGPDAKSVRLYNEGMETADAGNNILFFNRLAILDLDVRSNQPFENDRFVLQFNGEIYNYRELKSVLQEVGYVFHTTSDTEVLFVALQHWGIDALQKLNGMFAFCWIDKLEKRFLLARDRLGIKPLYYSQQKRSVIFASELDSIVRLSNRVPDINSSSIDMFLWMQFIPSPFTILKGVYKLPPGHYLEGTFTDLNKEQSLHPIAFWDSNTYSRHTSNNKEAPSDLESILTDSLSRQLIADVPLGLFLSSGVDSSLLAALIHKHFIKENSFNFFTVSFSESTDSDESLDAINYIRGFNNPSLQVHTINIDSRIIGSRLDELYNYFDEPFGDPTALLNWTISAKAREHVTVALSGDGADELFWGYKRYEKWKQPSLQITEKYGGISFSKQFANWTKPILQSNYWAAKRQLELETDPIYRHFTLFLSPVLQHLTEQPVWQKNIWAMQGIQELRCRNDLVAWLDLKTYLPDAMLYKVDRASMAASLEVRVPYLDNSVIDYALNVPFDQKSNNHFKNKAVLKSLLMQIAPHYKINRPKKGFNFPLDKWLRFDWNKKTNSLINKETLGSLGLDERIYLPKIKEYYSGNRKYCIAVWYLLNLALWHKKFKNLTPLQRL